MRTVYLENDVADHPVAQRILATLGAVEQVYCDRYTEVFNRRSQNFRLQKRKPAIILARKHAGHVMPAPVDYGLPDVRGYYFSTSLNCPYDCRYCFLQGMFRSAHHVVFVNYEDYAAAIGTAAAQGDGNAWFNAGYDNDSLAFERVTGAAEYFMAWFAERPALTLELRTKSAHIKPLLARDPVANVVCAFSIAPDTVARALEHRAPSLERRLQAMARLQSAGWQVGVRIEPVIAYRRFEHDYSELVRRLGQLLNPERTHSVSYGSYRMPEDFHRNIARLYPDEIFFASHFENHQGQTTYGRSTLTRIDELFGELLGRHLPATQWYRCGQGGSAVNAS